MTGVNDENTRDSVRQGHDALSTYLAHFSRPNATWESFGKADSYLEYLRLHMLEMLHTVEAELQHRSAVEPTEYGT